MVIVFLGRYQASFIQNNYFIYASISTFTNRITLQLTYSLSGADCLVAIQKRMGKSLVDYVGDHAGGSGSPTCPSCV